MEYIHTRINGDCYEYDLQERIVLKSRVWVIVGIVALTIVALAAAIGIYVYLQFNQVIV